MMHRLSLVSLALVAALYGADAFAPAFTPKGSINSNDRACHVETTTSLNFGIPTFGGGNKDEEEEEIEGLERKSIGASGFLQLLTAGLGAPFLGDYKGVDKETGKFMFSLEANNLVDENGESKQTKMPYFESGWVDEADAEKEKERKANGGGFKFW